jgi:hypothetical protein
MLLALIGRVVWAGWNRDQPQRWSTRRLAPALIIYEGDWRRMSAQVYRDLPRPYAVLALQTFTKYAKER